MHVLWKLSPPHTLTGEESTVDHLQSYLSTRHHSHTLTLSQTRPQLLPSPHYPHYHQWYISGLCSSAQDTALFSLHHTFTHSLPHSCTCSLSHSPQCPQWPSAQWSNPANKRVSLVYSLFWWNFEVDLHSLIIELLLDLYRLLKQFNI